ncbi:MAG TPA: hypothetical protein PLL30_03755 [Candidatus Krumholzibacteria bacterium]|nr:hypothetical protein [Candidatus Krumholzibacteria bacterium]HPD70889.1 hypothetical protein [Candidatus Krumholzibacteria bacterium]HRY39411.1 hypothetical protein [Candidatus Krumholzibacteria bacterium]
MTLARSPALTVLVVLALGAGAALAQSGGRIGNLNDPVPPSVPGLLVGNQVFAYLVMPDEQVACPDGGFILQTVAMTLDFTAEQVPATITVNAGLLDAHLEDNGFYVPGGEIGTSPEITVTIDAPGLHVIPVPLQGACGCEPTDAPYFLSFRYLGPAVANLAIDDQPAPGIVYLDSGNGYVDMYELGKTSGGKVIIWGDIVCCIAVGAEPTTWQDVKSLFR